MGKKNKGILYAIRKDKRKEIARQMKGVMKFVDRYFFIEGLPDDEYKKFKEKFEKLCKKVKEGEGLDKVLNEDNFRDLACTSPEFVEEFLEEDYEDYL